ncbi:dymeclin-like [Portunus trituberculatus]|nr:dymeclin-like [Portunus trituberculatus]XP_045122457.1 dymeclin-like [Portunus trituberculatus]XP_045122458.1 dymeclin-like [Portunus trituberculatus]
MGAGSSSISQLASNEYLKRFVSEEVLTPNDPFWNQLLSFTFSIPNTSSDHRLLEESIMPLYVELVQNHSKSGNVASLIHVFLSRATELKASAQCENTVFTWQAHNALFIVRCVCKLLIQHLSEEEVIEVLQTSPPNEEGISEDSQNLVEDLVTSLVEVVVDVPLADLTYALHQEATITLLVLTSALVFASGDDCYLSVLKMLMTGRASIHACLFVKTLLRRFMAQDKPPAKSERGSIILGLASGLWNVLTLGLASSGEEEQGRGPESPLASLSVLLLLVLTNHYTADRTTRNPYRQALLHAQNFHDPAESTPTQAVATFKLEFATLYKSLFTHLQDDQTTLLLYLLLHKNDDFRTYVLARTDVESLVLPILHTLYHAPDSTSHHIYMSLIILLILSEDDSFNKTIHDIPLKNITWYTERFISDISLGGLLILVVIRTITYNMTKMRDKYLHTNCLAALANMSSQFRSLHPYVCQRLVSLFETLSKRYSRLCESLRAAEDLLDESESEMPDALGDVGVLEEVLRMVLEILNSVLTHQLAHNHNLVYTLLYKQHLFHPFSTHPNFQDVTQNIEMVLSYLMGRLETTKRDPGVQDVQEVIQQGVLHLPKDRLKKFPELKFKYVEENEPEDFFIPYVWTLVYQKSGLYWNPKCICMFDPSQPDG